jgi:putative chitinase
MNQHVVKSGDTLSAIAKQYYGDTSRAKDIAKANGIENPDRIQVGWTLVLPDLSASAPTSEAPSSQPRGTSKDEGFRVTQSQLEAIMTTTAEVTQYCDAVNACLQRYEINTALRAAHFLAQVAHESGGFRYIEENLNYSAEALKSVFGKYFQDDALASDYARQPQKIANRVYADRMGNGSEVSGDGWRYRGRGLIQLTGKSNYTQYADSRQVDVVQTPDLVATDPILATDVAGWYWESRELNRYADNDDIRTITKRINGGYNGLEDRQGYLNRAKGAFGV